MMDNVIPNPFYSVIHSEVPDDPRGFRTLDDEYTRIPEDQERKEKTRTIGDQERIPEDRIEKTRIPGDQEQKEKKTKIPLSKFKLAAEKIKEERRHDVDKPPRRSSIPKLKNKLAASETKQPKIDPETDKIKIDNTVTSPTSNKATKDNIKTGTKENGEKDQANKNTNIPQLIKKKVKKLKEIGNSDTKVEEKHSEIDNNDAIIKVPINNGSNLKNSNKNNKTNDKSHSNRNVDDYNNTEKDNIEIHSEEQKVIDDFDKIYEDMGDSEEPDSIIDEIVEKINVDPVKMETTFEKIVHDYDKNVIQPINIGKPKNKIPLLKQKSLHEFPVAKLAERRLSLKNIALNDDENSEISKNANQNKKETVRIENKAPQSKDSGPSKHSKDIKKDIKNSKMDNTDKNSQIVEKETKKQLIVNEEIKTVNNLETVQYDNDLKVIEEIQLLKVENKPSNKKPSDDNAIKEKIKVVTPEFDKPKIVGSNNKENIVLLSQENKERDTTDKVSQVEKDGDKALEDVTKITPKPISVKDVKDNDSKETQDKKDKLEIADSKVKEIETENKKHIKTEMADSKARKEEKKITNPVFDKAQPAETVKTGNNDDKPKADENKIEHVDKKLQDKQNDVVKKATLTFEDIKTPDNVETIQYDQNIVITEEIKIAKLDKKPVTEKDPKHLDEAHMIHKEKHINKSDFKASAIVEEKKKQEVFEEIKSENNVEIIEYNNNQIVTEEIKIADVDKKLVIEKDPKHLDKTQIAHKEREKDKPDFKTPNIVKEKEKRGAVEEIKTVNNVEIVECNENQIVTEEVKLVHPKENKDNMPDSTKMVQNLLSQMGNKNKNEITDVTPKKDKFSDIFKTNKKQFDKQETKIEPLVADNSKSILHKLMNKIKGKDQEAKTNAQETPDDMPVKSSIKSKIAVFDKDKNTKLPPRFKQEKCDSNESDRVTKESNINDSDVLKINKILSKDSLERTPITKQPDHNTKYSNDYLDKPANDHHRIKYDSEKQPFKENTSVKKINKQEDFNSNLKSDNNSNKAKVNNKSIENLETIRTEKGDDYEEDNIPKGKVSSIINKIATNDNKEQIKPDIIIDLPKKKSVLSRIAMFERQISKEPPTLNFPIDSKTKEETGIGSKHKIEAETKPNHKTIQFNLIPKIVDETKKTHRKENIYIKPDSDNIIKLTSVNKGSLNNIKPKTNDSQKEIEETEPNCDQNTNEEYQNDKHISRNASNIIAKFEKSNNNKNDNVKIIRNNNEPSKKYLKEENDSINNKNAEKISVIDKNEVNQEINVNEREELRKIRNENQYLTEHDLGKAVKGKVKQLIVRINSKENLYQEFEKKETISVKEMPRKRTVLDRIALFEQKITAGPTGKPYTPTTEVLTTETATTEDVVQSTTTVENLEETTVESTTVNMEQLKKEEGDIFRRKIEGLNKARKTYGTVDHMPTIKLDNGQEMPVLAVGTALLELPLVPHVIKAAIDLGYRAFDTAYIYGNEREVGQAIKEKIDEGVVTRDHLFIINKLWSTFHRTDLVEKACRKSLELMGLKYFDLYLIHNPMSFKEGDDPVPKIANVMQYSESDYMDAWYGMEGLVKKGLVKSIGLSNFNATQVKRVYERSVVKPVVNQVECHPYLTQYPLAAVCDERRVTLSCFGVLGSKGTPQVECHPYLTQYPLAAVCDERRVTLSCFGVLGSKGTPQVLKSYLLSAIDDPILVTMAAGLNMTTAQLLIRYQLDRGHNAIVKASSAAHLWDNLQSLKFKLDDAHIAAIDALNRNKRMFTFTGMGETHRNYPFKA